MSYRQTAEPGRLSWIASLMKQLHQQVRVAPPGVADRARIVDIHSREINEFEKGLALAVVAELEGVTLPSEIQEDTGAESAAGEDPPPGSRIEWLLDNIETAQFGQQRQLQRRAHARK